uniref:Protein unc-93 homolog A n=1 Tax=Ciona intestinalis TaxID=7719 RepID=F7AMB1_CIOIN|nr:protein unc-93 homolog A isoform X1 [Ciona intestinalis]|eukprot:XP_009862471.1 protein unc-93 homolog A isoform X1 [Ciona intestinalis]
MVSTKFRCHRNLLLLSFGILTNMSAYLPLEAVQSSFNQAAGTSSLATVYIIAVLSSLFLAPLVISKFGSKRCILAGALSYVPYTLANFYPRDYTLIPAAAFVGAGGAVMWPACLVYIIDLSKLFARTSTKSQTLHAAKFFSIFYSIISCAYLAGMILLSVLFSTNVVESKQSNSTLNLNISAAPQEDTNTNIPISVEPKCGVTFDNLKSSTPTTNQQLSQVLLYTMLAVFLLFHFCGFMMCICIDDVEEPKENSVYWEGESEVHHDQSSLTESSVGLYEQVNKGPECNSNIKAVKQESMLTLCKSVITLITKDKVVLMMMVNTLQIGMMQAFYRGNYNSAWVSCSLGINFTAYTMVVYAAATLCGSFCSVKLLKCMDYPQLFGIVTFLEVTVFAILLFWAPAPNTSVVESWPFFILSAVLGFCKGVIKAQQPSVYNIVFVENKNTAATIQIMWESIGISSIYLISTITRPVVSTTIMICMIVLGYIFFLSSLYIKDKKGRYWSCARQST